MQEFDSFNLFKTMIEDGYTLDQVQKIIGLSNEEIELFSRLLVSDNKGVVNFNNIEEKNLDETKKAI